MSYPFVRIAPRVLSQPLPIRLRRLRTALLRTPVTAAYAILLLVSEIVMAALPSGVALGVDRAASTNITHLALDPLLVLPASAVVAVGNEWIWVPLTLLLFGGIERRLGSKRALLAAFGAHVAATLISEGVLLIRIAGHLAPRSDINVLDVGPSYVILAAMAGCLVIGSWPLRAAALVTGALIVPNLLVDLPEFDMSSVGHFSSLLLGAGFVLAFRLRRRVVPHVPAVLRDLVPDVAARLPKPAAANAAAA